MVFMQEIDEMEAMKGANCCSICTFSKQAFCELCGITHYHCKKGHSSVSIGSRIEPNGICEDFKKDNSKEYEDTLVF